MLQIIKIIIYRTFNIQLDALLRLIKKQIKTSTLVISM